MEARDRLVVALRSCFGTPHEFLLATNSIRIRFDVERHPKGRAYVWIDPPWLLLAGGTIVTTSGDCPTLDDEDKETSRQSWRSWCAHFDPLDHTSLAEVSVGLDHPDLRLGFASGHCIETFSTGGPGCWWYYRDCVTGEVFEAGRWGIRQEFGDPREA